MGGNMVLILCVVPDLGNKLNAHYDRFCHTNHYSPEFASVRLSRLFFFHTQSLKLFTNCFT